MSQAFGWRCTFPARNRAAKRPGPHPTAPVVGRIEYGKRITRAECGVATKMRPRPSAGFAHPRPGKALALHLMECVNATASGSGTSQAGRIRCCRTGRTGVTRPERSCGVGSVDAGGPDPRHLFPCSARPAECRGDRVCVRGSPALRRPRPATAGTGLFPSTLDGRLASRPAGPSPPASRAPRSVPVQHGRRPRGGQWRDLIKIGFSGRRT